MNYIYDHANRPRTSTAGHTIPATQTFGGATARLRRHYLALRRAGITATDARRILTDCLFMASLDRFQWHRNRPEVPR